MSKSNMRDLSAFTRAGTRAVAGYVSLPLVAEVQAQKAPEARPKRQLPWMFSVVQAGHFLHN